MKRRFLRTVATICILVPTAAYADESGIRLEARGGVAWNGASEERVGLGIGYDYCIGEGFIGLAQAVDTNAKFGFSEISTAIRAGANLGEAGRAYALAGFAIHNWRNEEFVVGAGYEHGVGEHTYLGIQYNRMMKSDVNRILVSAGYRF